MSPRQLPRIRHSDNTTIITSLRNQPHLNSKEGGTVGYVSPYCVFWLWGSEHRLADSQNAPPHLLLRRLGMLRSVRPHVDLLTSYSCSASCHQRTRPPLLISGGLTDERYIPELGIACQDRTCLYDAVARGLTEAASSTSRFAHYLP